MRRTNHVLLCGVTNLFFALIFGQGSFPNLVMPRSNKAQGTMSSESTESTTREAFVRTLIAARVPGGIVWKRACSGKELEVQSLNWSSGLRESLDAIVTKDRQYRWFFDKDAVNLVPKVGEPPLLKIRIGEFRTEQKSSAILVLEKLLALPEVRNGAKKLHLTRGLQLLVGPSSKREPLKIAVRLRGLTVREALNAIARAHGQAVWQYSEWHCEGKNEFSVEFVAD